MGSAARVFEVPGRVDRVGDDEGIDRDGAGAGRDDRVEIDLAPFRMGADGLAEGDEEADDRGAVHARATALAVEQASAAELGEHLASVVDG